MGALQTGFKRTFFITISVGSADSGYAPALWDVLLNTSGFNFRMVNTEMATFRKES